MMPRLNGEAANVGMRGAVLSALRTMLNRLAAKMMGAASQRYSGDGGDPCAAGGNSFNITIPQGAVPGDVLRVRVPNSTEMLDVKVAIGKRSGDKQGVPRPPSPVPRNSTRRAGSGMLNSLAGANSSLVDDFIMDVNQLREAQRASCESLRLCLDEELEMQRGFWASDLVNVAEDKADDLSQVQALVLACAEAGDCQQLLAALDEAQQFTTVRSALRQAVQTLSSAEEAMVTLQCLSDALCKEDRSEIELWLEQSLACGLEVPPRLPQYVEELRKREVRDLKKYDRRRDLERKLEFATEAGDQVLMKEVLAEAKSFGITSPSLQLAAEQRAQFDRISGTSPAAAAAAERGAAGGARIPSAQGASRAGTSAAQDKPPVAASSSPHSAAPAATSAPPAPTPPANSARPASPVASGSNVKLGNNALLQPTVPTTVWDRRKPPAYITTRIGRACYLLGLNHVTCMFTAEALKIAYRKAAMECHPDKQHNHGRSEEAKALFQQVKQTHDFLKEMV